MAFFTPDSFGLLPLRTVEGRPACSRFGPISRREVEDEDITARCFCHEIEHLDGHLFSEHCDRLLTDEELEQYLKEHEDEYEREDDE